jgi:hypothetical protein
MKVLVGNVNKVNKAFQHMGKQTEVIIKAMNNAIVKNLKNIFKGHPIIFKLELINKQPIVDDKTIELVQKLLAEFDIVLDPLPPLNPPQVEEAAPTIDGNQTTNTTEAIPQINLKTLLRPTMDLKRLNATKAHLRRVKMMMMTPNQLQTRMG